MKNFVWTNEYSVGIGKFDEQHKKLFEILKELYVAMEDKDNKIALAMVINDLKNFAKEHFLLEEDMMIKYHYPQFENHQKQHRIFESKVTQFADDFNAGKYLLHFDILIYLKNWIIQHVLVTDKAYSEFFRSQGVQ